MDFQKKKGKKGRNKINTKVLKSAGVWSQVLHQNQRPLEDKHEEKPSVSEEQSEDQVAAPEVHVSVEEEPVSEEHNVKTVQRSVTCVEEASPSAPESDEQPDQTPVSQKEAALPVTEEHTEDHVTAAVTVEADTSVSQRDSLKKTMGSNKKKGKKGHNKIKNKVLVSAGIWSQVLCQNQRPVPLEDERKEKPTPSVSKKHNVKTVQRSETLVEEPKEHINETKQVAKVQGQYQPAPQVCEEQTEEVLNTEVEVSVEEAAPGVSQHEEDTDQAPQVSEGCEEQPTPPASEDHTEEIPETYESDVLPTPQTLVSVVVPAAAASQPEVCPEEAPALGSEACTEEPTPSVVNHTSAPVTVRQTDLQRLVLQKNAEQQAAQARRQDEIRERLENLERLIEHSEKTSMKKRSLWKRFKGLFQRANRPF